MSLPAGYRLRAPGGADLEAAAAVLAADDLDDAGEVVLDLGFLQRQWGRPGFDLGSDAWLVEDPAGTVVAYGQVTLDDPDVAASWGVVHPDCRGRGIGPVLLDRIEARAEVLLRAAQAPRFRHSVNAGDEAAAAMLLSRGLHPVRHWWHMRIDLPSGAATRTSPPGVTITGLRSPDDLRRVHAVAEEAFADHWGHEPEAFEPWAAYFAQGPGYDPTLWRLAWRDGRLAGALVATIAEGRGWVNLLGVRRAERGRGIGQALLRHAFAGLSKRSVERAYLAVDAQNPTGATRLYERAGMRVVKRWDMWERSPEGRR
jgi:mycothiol synthase